MDDGETKMEYKEKEIRIEYKCRINYTNNELIYSNHNN